ncbi:MAG: DegV family protein [Anaerolineales bacterium]|nr:DegV family protein [Anaerolineales bacterium]
MVKIITDTTACLPKTAAPPPELFAAEFKRLSASGETILFGRSTDGYLSVMHAGVPEQGQELADDLGVTLGLKDIPILDVPPAIVTHGGPGILGVSFFAGK